MHLTGPGDAWFDLEAMAWFEAPDWAAFQTIRDQLLLACLDIIGEAGAALNGAPLPPQPQPPQQQAQAQAEGTPTRPLEKAVH